MVDNILTSIGIGLLATTSPCVFPLYPGYLAYLSASQGNNDTDDKHHIRPYVLGFFVLLGVLTMMLALGGIIAALSVSIGKALAVVIPLADLTLILLGVLLLLDRNPFKMLPQIKIPALQNPLLNAFIYGLFYGPIALPCSGPLVVSIFAVSLKSAGFLSRLSTFLWFGLGFGLPLLVISFFGGAFQRPITLLFARNARWVNLASGVLIIGLGIFDLFSNWSFITSAFN
jgi:cytochrome c-type biogenesis protein